MILGKSLVQGLNGTTLYAEEMYPINFTVTNGNGNNSYLYVNNKQITKFKTANSEIMPYPLCLGGLPKYFSLSNEYKV